MKTEVEIAGNAEALFRAAADELARQAHMAINARGRFTIALSGGSTPKSLYALLAKGTGSGDGLPWEKMYFFWGDERHVPPDHPESNYLMACEALLSHVAVPPANIHRIKGEMVDAWQAADEYERSLRAFFQVADGNYPRFDCMLLGMGPDGHTASLFPDTAALSERRRLVVANWVATFDTYRITVTLPVLNHSSCVIFLVSGVEKAATLRDVLEGAAQPTRLPAQQVSPLDGRLLWLLDQDAASLLSRR